MSNRQALTANHLDNIARVNLSKVEMLTSGITVTPSVQQAFQEAVANEHPFLKKVAFQSVVAMTGQKIQIGVGSIAGRTPAGTTRTPNENINTTDRDYLLHQTQYDSFFPWSKLDNWAHMPNFSELWRSQITKQISRDIVTIGFNGLKSNSKTDKTENPLLQDVDRGWLQAIREDAPLKAMGWGKADTEGAGLQPASIKVGQSEDCPYKNLDALVKDAVDTLIEPQHQAGLVVICHPSMLNGDNLKIINQDLSPEQRAIARVVMLQSNIGGLAVETVDMCPRNTLLITALENLSIYDQIGSARRTIYENPHRQGIEDLSSINRGYVVEDYRAVALIEHIEFV
jgi:P2 family phage major capsid protein